MPAPNIFALATSELTQDAMLSWLLAWADPSNAEVDAVLHATGRRFVDALFATHGREAPKAKICIRRQEMHTDVLAEVGDTVIAIEDKVGSGQHSNQLVRYRDALEEKYPNRPKVLVYLKTIEQASYSEVEDAGWKVLQRGDLLEVLRPADTENAILRDFVDHLEGIETATLAFETAPLEAWKRPAYRGFFVRLNEELRGHWRFVANPAGGFMGYWWNSRTVEHGKLYLQLESGRSGKKQRDRLVVKFSVGEQASATDARERWLDPVRIGMASQGFKRPKQLRRGATMTLAVQDGDYRVQREGRLDLAATVERLRDAAKAPDALSS